MAPGNRSYEPRPLLPHVAAVEENIRAMLDARVTEPVALPAPGAQSPEATPEPKQKHKTNRLMREADTAVGPRERKPSRR